MEHAGIHLKAAREAKNMSVEDVAVITKISVQNIVDIENGTLGKNYPKFYVKSFTKLYAEAVEVTLEDITEKTPAKKQSVRKTARQTIARKKEPFKHLKSVASTVAAGFVKVFVKIKDSFKKIRITAKTKKMFQSIVVAFLQYDWMSKKENMAVGIKKIPWKIVAGIIVVFMVLVFTVKTVRHSSEKKLLNQSALLELIELPPAPYSR